MTIEICETNYQVGGLLIISRQWKGCYRASFTLCCPECNEEHVFTREGPEYWYARCPRYKVEWTLTPKEMHVSTPIETNPLMLV